MLDLLARGARATERSNDGSTALHYCARYNDHEIAAVLVEHSGGCGGGGTTTIAAVLDARNNARQTAFDVCLEEHAHDVAALLVSKGCSLASSLTGDVVAQMLGAADNDDDGIDDDAQDESAASAWDPVLRALARRAGGGGAPQLLHVALERESSGMLARLLDLGFDPDAAEGGYRPIHQAIIRRRRGDVERLIARGADTNALLPGRARRGGKPGKPGKNGKKSAEPRHELLTTIGARGYTPLLLAANIVNDVPIVQLLLANGADPNFVFPAG